MRRRRLLLVIGVLVVFCISGVSCAPIETAGSGPVYGQTEPLPGPPPGDFAQAVLDQRADYRRALGKDLRDKAYGLQQRGLFKDAVGTYRESLSWWPDPGLDGYVAMVERAAGLPSSSGTAPWPQTSGSTVRNGEVIATIRNRSDRDTYIFAAKGVESPETFFLAGEIREVALPIGPSGEVVLSASRDGRILASKRWYGKPGDPIIVPSVLFEEGGVEKLLIMTGFRVRQ